MKNEGPLTGEQFEALINYINRSVRLSMDALEDRIARGVGRPILLAPEVKANHAQQVEEAFQAARRVLVGEPDA